MKRIFLVCLLLFLLPVSALSQHVTMEEVHLSYDYPESWLVVSPQLARVYAPLLNEAGIADTLPEELEAQGIASRAYSEDFAQWISVLTASDETAQELYDIERVTDAQRKKLKSRMENNGLWETTGYRAQDVEWQKIGNVFWLYCHYTRTRGDEIIGRGLRYLTIRNGMYIELDWQIAGRRFGNRDLANFRAQAANLLVTENVPEPRRAVKLTAEIPAETSTAEFTIIGETTPGATLVCETSDSAGRMQVLSVGEVGTNGAFSLSVQLEDEGTFDLFLTASKEGMDDAVTTGKIAYSAKTLPVTLNLPEDGMSRTDEVTLTGTTLAGVTLQLVTPYGISKKTASKEGKFSFDLTTKEEGVYNYTLICDKKGFNQRRVQFSLTREITEAQAKQQVRDNAEKISYANLQKNLPANQGKTLRIHGPVVSIDAGGGVSYIRMYYSKDASGKWYNPVYVVANEDTGAKPGDMMTVVTTVAGVYEEQNERGEPVMIPRLELTFVDKIE